MEQRVYITRWERAGAVAAEGLCLLWRLLPAAAQLIWLQQRLPLPHAMWLPLGAAALQGLLLSPWRLSRQAVYCRIAVGEAFSLAPLAAGWRLWGRAVAWRWHLWWRRAAALWTALTPACLLWYVGASAAVPVLWLFLGSALLLLSLTAAGIFLCRYAAAAVLILQGWPAGAAVGFSARVMQGHIREYINFLGNHLLRLAACAFVIPAPWLLPRFRSERAALLLHWVQEWRDNN